MLAALLLNPIVVALPTKPSDAGAGQIDYVWPPPGYEIDVDREIERQEQITQAARPAPPAPPAHERAVEIVERRLVQDLARRFDLLEADARELVGRQKAEYLAQKARQAVEAGDEEALIMILLAME